MENSYGELRRLSESHAKMQTLMHHVNRENLMAEHWAQVSGKAAGIDGATKESYGAGLEEHVDALLGRMKSLHTKTNSCREQWQRY